MEELIKVYIMNLKLSLLLFFFSASCLQNEKSNQNNSNTLPKESINKQIEINNHNKLFASFWEGMSTNQFNEVRDYLIDQGILEKKEYSLFYNFNFRYKSGDIYHVPVIVSSHFEEEYLKAIELIVPRTIDCKKRIFTEDIMAGVLEEPEKCVINYDAKNIYDLYIIKYGKPTTTLNPNYMESYMSTNYSAFFDFQTENNKIIRIKEKRGERVKFKTLLGMISGKENSKPNGEYIEYFNILYCSYEYAKNQLDEFLLNERQKEVIKNKKLNQTNDDI